MFEHMGFDKHGPFSIRQTDSKSVGPDMARRILTYQLMQLSERMMYLASLLPTREK